MFSLSADNRGSVLVAALVAVACSSIGRAADPPAVNPFGPRPAVRQDAVPGYVELSDGQIHYGMVYLTRDARLKIHDKKLQRQREIPLRVVKQIDCQLKREWMEKEWRFKETTSDEKMYSGRKYPVREYLHTITLGDGRKIKGPLSALVYVRAADHAKPPPGSYVPVVKPQRFILHKRDKGKVGADLKSLKYVRCVKLGKEALEEGRRKALKRKEGSKKKDGSKKKGR